MPRWSPQRGRSQARKWLDTVLNRRVEVELADAAGTLEGSVPPASALWPALSGLGHPAQQLTSACGDRRATRSPRLPWATGAKTSAHGGRRSCVAGDGSDVSRTNVSPLAWAALFTNKGTPRKLGDAPASPRCKTCCEQLTDAGARSRRRTWSTGAWCACRGCCWPSTPPTSASAAWPTWPTWSAARSRCCATARSPAGCRSGSTPASATC